MSHFAAHNQGNSVLHKSQHHRFLDHMTPGTHYFVREAQELNSWTVLGSDSYLSTLLATTVRPVAADTWGGGGETKTKNGQVNNILLHNVEDVAELEVIHKTVSLRYLCEPPYP